MIMTEHDQTRKWRLRAASLRAAITTVKLTSDRRLLAASHATWFMKVATSKADGHARLIARVLHTKGRYPG